MCAKGFAATLSACSPKFKLPIHSHLTSDAHPPARFFITLSHCKFLLPSFPPTPFNPHAAPTPILSFHAFYKELGVALRPPRQDGLLLVRMGWEVGLRAPRQDGLLLVRMGWEVGLRPPLVRMGCSSSGWAGVWDCQALLIRMGCSSSGWAGVWDCALLVRMGWGVGCAIAD